MIIICDLKVYKIPPINLLTLKTRLTLSFAFCVCFICNSYAMGCPSVRGGNPRALAHGLSYVRVDKLFYTTQISVDLAYHGVFPVWYKIN